MSKLAAKKTAGIVGDDLAVNANVVVGLDPSRELPIVGKIALGSLANKALLIPLALALPTSVIKPLLMLGGAFLCFEALHKLTHPKRAADGAASNEVAPSDPEALKRLENQKIWGAIGTDTILSAEVIAVALGAVAEAPLATRALTLVVVGLAMTVGVYGLVAAIVKADDLGFHLQSAKGETTGARWRRGLGRGLVAAMPRFMKLLSVLGTAAMFTVGGGILLHAFPVWEAKVAHLVSGPLAGTVSLAVTLLFGVLVGALSLPIFSFPGWLWGKLRRPAPPSTP